MEDKDTSECSSYGRVVRLHFACSAPLPIGSSLRVTSSQLWAPGMMTPEDPTDARNISNKTHEVALPDNTTGATDGVDGGIDSQSVQQSYASSVEMVTSPDEWPVWRTRKPVVISLRHHHGRIEHHRYRYMVVNPGAAGDEDIEGDDRPIDDDEMMEADGDGVGRLQGERGLSCATTQDGENLSTEVMMWEDPFGTRQSQKDLLQRSTVSLPSVRLNNISKTLANLPYRTVEIDTVTAQVMYADDMEDENSDTTFTENGIRLDTWNKSQDRSFHPYLAREQLNKANKAKKQMLTLSRQSSTSSDKIEVVDTDISNIPTSRLQSKFVSFSDLGQVVPDVVVPGVPEVPSATTSLTATGHPMGSTKSLASATGSKAGPQRIFFTCFHLPIILSYDDYNKKWKATWAESLLAATDGSGIVRDYDVHWIGTVDCKSHPITTQDDRDEVTAILANMDCTPLFLDRDIQDAHYLGMCKQVLWPAFHNVDLLDLKGSASGGIDGGARERRKGSGDVESSEWDQSRLDSWWDAYKQVNQMFGEKLSLMLNPGDIMWVHDYHLSLLPKIMDEREREEYGGRSVTKKVFLLHIPFPTSMCFRELECGEEILKGMLHADMVGFHAFDHARHFLNATKRILGLNHESLVGGLIGIKVGRKTVLVTMHNVSIEPFSLDAALANPLVEEYSANLREQHSSRHIIAGIDIAQRLSGVSLKLLAFERLLADYPVWQEKVVMVQKCLVSGSRHSDESTTIMEVRQLAKRIQSRFGPNVIDYEEVSGSSIPIYKRLALWKVADVLMVTPIREGLNLLPMEYVYTKKQPAAPGVVISSEFSVVSSVLNGALRVNPFDVQMTVTSIDKALTMDIKEKDGRRERDTAFVTSCSSSSWTRSVLNDLYDATAVTNDNDDNDSEDTSIMASKFDKQNLITCTASFLAHEKEIAFAHLDINSVVDSYKCTKKRVLVLDLNGTIIIKEPAGKYLKRDTLGSSGFDVNPEVREALSSLCADPKNIVFVVSGDSQENVVKAVGNIPGVGLAASNGACFAPPLIHGETERKWKYFDLGVDWEAVKKIVLPILAKYTARSNGAFVKLTHSSIGWSYYSCDPEWGSLQASHLVFELEQALRAFDVRFVMIKGIVEVVPRQLNKGVIVGEVLRQVKDRNADGEIDFILCMGDDVQDEKMFTAVFSFISEQENLLNASRSLSVTGGNGQPVSNSIFASVHGGNDSNSRKLSADLVSKDPLYAFTTVVGKKNSHAFTFVDDARDVSTLLRKLASDGDTTLSDEAMAGVEPVFL